MTKVAASKERVKHGTREKTRIGVTAFLSPFLFDIAKMVNGNEAISLSSSDFFVFK